MQAGASQLHRMNCQRRSPNASPLLPQVQQRAPSQDNKVNNRNPPTPKTNTLTTDKSKHTHQNKYRCFLLNNQQQHHTTLFGNPHNHYYSSKMDRSIDNCEKFLPDQDLNGSVRENDLLLIHARQSTGFM
jgi:hypothetical protein